MSLLNEQVGDNSTYRRIIQKHEYGLKMLETEIGILLQEFAHKHKYNPVEHIKSRIKSQESIIAKLENKNLEPTLYNLVNNIHDIIGIRIVCSFLTDVYDIVQMIAQSDVIKVIERKDYISYPKKSGYSSYHLIVLVPIYLTTGVEYVEAEIQIRTVAMDFWASLDHKMRYKFSGDIPQEVQEEMYNVSKDIISLDKKMLDLNMAVNKSDK